MQYIGHTIPGPGPVGLPGIYGMIFLACGFVVALLVLYFGYKKSPTSNHFSHHIHREKDPWGWYGAIILLFILVTVIIILSRQYAFHY